MITARQAGLMGPEHRTLIDDALEAVDERSNPYPPDFLRAFVIGTYFAGMDTVALICSFALYALLKHPQVWERVTVKVREVFSRTQTSTMQDFK